MGRPGPSFSDATFDSACVQTQGNLSEFVKVRPEARSYYELSAAKIKFNLPKPGFLDGVKSRVRN